MIIEIFAICDAATDSAGRLNILGAFEGIVGRNAPIVRDRCSVVARMRFSRDEAGEHLVSVRFLYKGTQQITREMKAKYFAKVPAQRESASINLILNISRIKFDQFGEYEIALFYDGEKRSSIPLTVARDASVIARNRMDN